MSTKAAIWVRVSTDRQHEDNQIPDLERLCEHRGWEIARRYEIADASAYKGEHRQALQRMLDDAHRGEFSVLVVWAVDRLCRQGIEELLRLIRELRERNVSLVSHQEPWLAQGLMCAQIRAVSALRYIDMDNHLNLSPSNQNAQAA